MKCITSPKPCSLMINSLSPISKVSPCHFGVDMATKAELIASTNSVDEIREFIGADSLGFLSEKGLLEAVSGQRSEYCMGCFTGTYPIPVQLEMDKLVLET